MKKLAFLLVVVALFLAATLPAAADGPYRRVVIPLDIVTPWYIVVRPSISVAIQPIGQLSDGSWEEPNGVTAFFLEPWPQAIYMPWAGRVSPGGRLQSVRPGSTILLYRDWCAEDEPLRLRVTRVQIIAAEDEDNVLDRVGGCVFALITYPPCNNVNQRLVVWAVADHRY